MNLILTADPVETLQGLIKEASASGEKEPTAMTLTTMGRNGFPAPRTVLFKGMLRGGLSFYSNYKSEKAQELALNPKASLSFFWPLQYRQVHILGLVERSTRDESEAYFKTRAHLSQIGAWASEQSQVLESYEALADKVKFFEQKFQGQEVPCPPHWGGYILRPLRFEFWFGREGRLHDRFRLERSSDTAAWAGVRLYP